MGKIFNVEVRALCKICGNPITGRYRTFCSKGCRGVSLYRRRKDYNKKWQAKKRGEYSEDKIQCLDCGRWYVQVGTHVIQAHGYESAREYREAHDLEVKRGTVPEWYRELKADKVFENGTVENLKAGQRYWFIQGDPMAGKYHRSHITRERFKKLHKLRGGGKR